MYDDIAPRLAELITAYAQPVQPGDRVMIYASTLAEPLVRALYEAVLRHGGHPIPFVSLPGLGETLLEVATDEQLTFANPANTALLENADILYSIKASHNTRSQATVPPERLALLRESSKPFMKLYRERRDAGLLRWNISAWPTHAAAQEAEMGLLAYTAFFYNACGLDQPDPVAYWKNLRARQDNLIAWLDGKKQIEVRGPGIELSLSMDGRRWVNCYGDKNFPDGEIFTCPVETTVNGHVHFSFPTVYRGQQVSGVRLTFKDGEVVEASAEKGEEFLLNTLDADPGARRLGEFAIGTNLGIQQFTGDTLFDEKIGGTIHMALGNAFTEANGTNESIVHWDMVHNMRDGGEIYVDGTLFYRNGDFVEE